MTASALYQYRPRVAPGTVCSLCGGANPVVDHCHQHGWVRGPACRSCNRYMAKIDKQEWPNLPDTLPVQVLLDHRAKCPDCPPLVVSDLVRPVTKDQPVTVVLAPSTKDQIAAAARKRGIKMSNLARIAIIEWLARESE